MHGAAAAYNEVKQTVDHSSMQEDRGNATFCGWNYNFRTKERDKLSTMSHFWLE
jgi:hypothetical protein